MKLRGYWPLMGGWKIRFAHYRPALVPVFVRELGDVFVFESAPQRYSRRRGFGGDFVGYSPATCGGYTVCQMEKEFPDGNTVFIQEIADCHPGDTFCYKTGRDVSYWRAVRRAYKFDKWEFTKCEVDY